MTGIEFHTIEIEAKIRSLVAYFSTLNNDPDVKQKDQKKFNSWVQDLEKILVQISLFENQVLPLITADLKYSFKNRNLYLTAMMRPDIRNIFTEIKTQFGLSSHLPISPNDLDFLIAGPDAAASLAWAGDTAIKYALLLQTWQPGITSEELHNKRKSLETNKNLSELCDRWDLYRHRFHPNSPDPEEKKREEVKGTLTEAIIGVIFIEQGIEGVQTALPFIDRIKK